MGKDHTIQVLEKRIEKSKTQAEKQPHIQELLKIDPKNKLAYEHDRHGKWYKVEERAKPVTRVRLKSE